MIKRNVFNFKFSGDVSELSKAFNDFIMKIVNDDTLKVVVIDNVTYVYRMDDIKEFKKYANIK